MLSSGFPSLYSMLFAEIGVSFFLSPVLFSLENHSPSAFSPSKLPSLARLVAFVYILPMCLSGFPTLTHAALSLAAKLTCSANIHHKQKSDLTSCKSCALYKMLELLEAEDEYQLCVYCRSLHLKEAVFSLDIPMPTEWKFRFRPWFRVDSESATTA